MTQDFVSLRAAYPPLAEGRLCYLDWAATGLLPRTGRDAVIRLAEELTACPDGVSTWMHATHSQTRERLRVLAARELGAAPEDLALVENTTAGLNAVAEALPLAAGDNVVLGASDYLAVAMPWKRRAERGEGDLRFVAPRDGRFEVEDLLAAVDARTRAVAISTIAWTSGALLDVEPLADALRERGVPLFLDAIQTFGVAPLDVARLRPAMVAVGGHKWLGSALGAGFLYVDPAFAAQHPPARVGFLSGTAPRGSWWSWFQDPQSGPEEEVLFEDRGRSFESGGTPSYPGALGLLAGLELLSATGISRILEHVRALGTELIAGLEERGLRVLTPQEPRRRAGIVVVSLAGGGDAERALAARLADEGIVVGVRYAGGVGGLRVSLHGPNDRSDVARLLAALDRLGVSE